MSLPGKFFLKAIFVTGATLASASSLSAQERKPETKRDAPVQVVASREGTGSDFEVADAEACVVIDKNPPGKYYDEGKKISYDFRNGVVHFNEESFVATAISMMTLQKDGQERALEAFRALPASAGCKAPMFMF